MLVFGSDWPVVTHDPLQGVANAVNRPPWEEGMPRQCQTLMDTLLAYTHDAAYAEFQEHQKGQIREGYLADLVTLSNDLFEVHAVEIAGVRSLLTMVNGRVVHEV